MYSWRGTSHAWLVLKAYEAKSSQIIFDNVPVNREDLVSHLGIFLDSKLDFRKHIQVKIAVANKGISLLKFLAKYVNRET